LAQIDTKKAREDFNAAIERDSSDPLPRLGLGLAIIRKGKLKEGREELEIAVALDPTNSLIRSYVGKAYYEENTKERDTLAGDAIWVGEAVGPKGSDAVSLCCNREADAESARRGVAGSAEVDRVE